MRTAAQLGWYRYLAHNGTRAGSLFTLLHLPFMLAFASLVVVGVLPLPSVDPSILALSAAAVAMVLYGEHMLDDTTMVGKPWGTVFTDRALTGMAASLFAAALVTGAAGSLLLGSALPLAGVAAGVASSSLYGLEVRWFHTVAFGAAGMGAIPAFSYLAQSIALQAAPDLLIAAALFAAGVIYGYVMLSTYERTKVDGRAWTTLAIIFLGGYAAALVALFRPLL